MKSEIQVSLDGKTIERVWSEMHDGLHAFIAKRVYNEADGDDILQEVFLRVHQRLDSLKDPKRLPGWMYQIVRHAIVDHYREKGKRLDKPMGLIEDVEKSRRTTPRTLGDKIGLGEEAREEMSACIRPLVAQLSQEYRDALVLVELEGYSQRVVAQKMGVSLSGMKSRVQRGRKQLRDLLYNCCLVQFDQRKRVMSFSRRRSNCGDCA